MANRIILKSNGINTTSDSPTGYKYVGYDGEIISEKSGATVSAITDKGYKEFVAKVYQSSTASPTFTVLENTIGSISYNYLGVGQYQLFLTNGFPTSKTVINIQESVEQENQTARVYNPNNDQIIIETSLNSVFSDDRLTGNSLFIRVYD